MSKPPSHHAHTFTLHPLVSFTDNIYSCMFSACEICNLCLRACPSTSCVCVSYIYLYKCVFDRQWWCQALEGERWGAAPLLYDAAVTLDQSVRCIGRQAGRQAAAHSRGNDTALLLREKLAEREWGEMGYMGYYFSCALTLCVISLNFLLWCCHAAFVAR